MAVSGASAQPRYAVTHLGNLPGGSTVYAQGVNNAGVIVGAVGVGLVGSKAFVWQRGAITEAPGTLGGPFVQAYAINEQGVVVGEATDIANNLRPVKWVNGVMIPLALLGNSGSARGVNSRGDVVGYSRLPNGSTYHAVKWDAEGLQDLGLAPGLDANSQANAISDHGDAIGTASGVPGSAVPILWDRSGGAWQLASLTIESAQAVGINQLDTAVGSVKFPGQDDLAARFGGEVGYYPLGRLPGDVASRALAINNRGTVVGWSKTNNTTIRAVMWAPNAEAPINLNSLIPAGSAWQLQVATSINDRGWIVGWGLYNGQRRAFLLRPSCSADIATAGSTDPSAGPDGFVTGEDFDLFVQAYFKEQVDAYGILLADLVTSGTGQMYPDGMVTGEDFDAFIQAYFTPCQ